MSQFVKILSERSLAYSPVAVQLIDDFTGEAPRGRVSFSLQEETGTDQWSDLDIAPVRNAVDVFTYPDLGRTANPTDQPRTHRALIDAEYYQVTEVGFLTHLFSDDHPLDPGQYAQGVGKVKLTPNSRYPYENHVRHLRGKVVLGENGPPVPGVELRHQSFTVFANGVGEFTLPVRFPAQDTRTTAASELNSIKVLNARGYAKAVLSVAGANGNSYRVFEIKWKDPAAPADYEATLTLDPLPGSDDLPAGLPASTKVSLITFALLIDIPPYTPTEIEHIFDVPSQNAFQKFRTIMIPSTP